MTTTTTFRTIFVLIALGLGAAPAAVLAGPPPASSCNWIPHSGKYLGGEDRPYKKLLSLTNAQKICTNNLGMRCKGVTCEDERGYSCAPRLGEPFLADSTDPKEVSWVKECVGLQKGMKVMTYFEAEHGRSYYMEPAEVMALTSKYHITVKFLHDGATQVVPPEWIDFDAPVKEGADMETTFFEMPAELFAVVWEHPLLFLLPAFLVLFQIRTTGKQDSPLTTLKANGPSRAGGPSNGEANAADDAAPSVAPPPQAGQGVWI